jgi:hypothetical protein
MEETVTLYSVDGIALRHYCPPTTSRIRALSRRQATFESSNFKAQATFPILQPATNTGW